MTEGMNMGIFVLLCFILPVLGAFAGFIGYLVWRASHPLDIEDGISLPGQGS